MNNLRYLFIFRPVGTLSATLPKSCVLFHPLTPRFHNLFKHRELRKVYLPKSSMRWRARWASLAIWGSTVISLTSPSFSSVQQRSFSEILNILGQSERKSGTTVLVGLSAANRETILISVPTTIVEPSGAFSTYQRICSVEPLASAASTTSLKHSGWTMILASG